jgi:hypothetical protein
LDLQCKSSWILNNFHWKVNWIVAEMFLEELECAFGVVGKIILMSMILLNLFGKIWIQNVWYIYIDFKVISAAEYSKNSPKNQVY